jgi:hypothetical protein
VPLEGEAVEQPFVRGALHLHRIVPAVFRHGDGAPLTARARMQSHDRFSAAGSAPERDGPEVIAIADHGDAARPAHRARDRRLVGRPFIGLGHAAKLAPERQSGCTVLNREMRRQRRFRP